MMLVMLREVMLGKEQEEEQEVMLGDEQQQDHV